jgi:hypothetical protein
VLILPSPIDLFQLSLPLAVVQRKKMRKKRAEEE